MTVSRIANTDRWVGMSADKKPTPSQGGSTYYEMDTGKTWTWNGLEWVQLIPSETSNETMSRRLSEDLLTQVQLLNDRTLELLDLTDKIAKEKTFKRKEYVFFGNYNPVNDANYVWDKDANTDRGYGWLDTEGYDIIQFSVMVTTLGSTGILLLIQGDVAGQLTDFYTETFAAVTTRAKLITVMYPPKRMRVGLMVTVNGTDSVTVACEYKKMGVS